MEMPKFIHYYIGPNAPPQENDFMDNFYDARILHEGTEYKTVEHFFQVIYIF